MTTTSAGTRHLEMGDWIKHGVIGGIVAAIGMMMAEMILAAAMGMDAFMPPRMIGGIVLGKSAMDPGTPLMMAALAGILVHMILSMVYGVIFAWLTVNIHALQTTTTVIVGGLIYGLVLWVVNFYVIAPPAGWVWFPTMANPVQQIISHAIGFGLVLGIYFERVLVHRLASRPAGASIT